MFDEDDDTLLPGTENRLGAHDGTEHWILGIVFIVTAGVSIAVVVHGWCIPGSDTVEVELVGNNLAELIGKHRIKGHCKKTLRRIGCGHCTGASCCGTYALRAVCIQCVGLPNRGGLTRLIKSCYHKPLHFFYGKLAEQLVPLRVVIRNALEVGVLQVALLCVVNAFNIMFLRNDVVPMLVICIRVVLECHVFDFAADRVHGLCIVGKTVLSGEVLASGSLIKLVVSLLVVGGTLVGSGVDIVLIQRGLLGVIGDMGVGADGECVLAGVEAISALLAVRILIGVVVGGNLLNVHRNLYGLGLAGCQKLGLGNADKLDSGFLYAVVLIIFGIRNGDIELYDFLASAFAGVLDFDFDVKLIRSFQLLRDAALELLLEGGIGAAGAERIGDNTVIVAIVEGLSGLRIFDDSLFGGGGLIEAVAVVDALYIVYIVGALGIGCFLVTEVCSGRVGVVVIDPGVNQTAGRIDGAVQDFAKRLEGQISSFLLPHKIAFVPSYLAYLFSIWALAVLRTTMTFLKVALAFLRRASSLTLS